MQVRTCPVQVPVVPVMGRTQFLYLGLADSDEDIQCGQLISDESKSGSIYCAALFVDDYKIQDSIQCVIRHK
jgi:hypothetical protein